MQPGTQLADAPIESRRSGTSHPVRPRPPSAGRVLLKRRSSPSLVPRTSCLVAHASTGPVLRARRESHGTAARANRRLVGMILGVLLFGRHVMQRVLLWAGCALLV